MRAHTPHPWAPIPEKTACQKTCRLSHSPKVTEVPTGGLGVFGACGPPNAGAPPIRTQSRPESPVPPSDETRPKGRALVCRGKACQQRTRGPQRTYDMGTFIGMGRGLPHPKTQKHGPFRTPQSTQKTVVTLVLGFWMWAGGLHKTPSLLGGLHDALCPDRCQVE